MSVKNLIFGIVLGIALAAGIWLAMAIVPITPPPQPSTATVLPIKVDVPAFSLLDQHGNSINEDAFKGQWDLVFFGFTHCPDVCPLTLAELDAARMQLQEAGHAPLPRIVLVSVDPERDTPDRMSGYLSNFAPGKLGITGDLDQLRVLTGAFGIFFEKQQSDSDYYAVDHSAVVLLIDPDGRLHALFGSPHRAQNFVNDFPLLTRS